MSLASPNSASVALSLCFLMGCGPAAIEQVGAIEGEEHIVSTTYPDGAPRAEKRAHTVESPHGLSREDNYYWLRDDDREDPAILGYLEAENAYVETTLAPLAELRESLFEEIVGRIAKDDSSAPAELDGSWFYRRYESGQEHPYYCRRVGAVDAAEEIVINGPELAGEHAYWSLGGWELTPDQSVVAWSEDVSGRRRYRLRFRNLTTGELYPETIENTSGAIAWADDNKTVFYVLQNEETLRSEWVYRHTLGTDPSEDVLVFHESDEAYYLHVTRSPAKRFIMIESWSTLTTEHQTIPTADPSAAPTPVLPREEGHEYSVVHLGDQFFVRTNRDATNFKIMRAPIATSQDPTTWTEVAGHRDDVLIHDLFAFDNHLVVNERRGGIRRLRVMDIKDGVVDAVTSRDVEMEEDAYATWFGSNWMTSTKKLRFYYSSLTTPMSDIEVDLVTGEKTVLKREQVVGDFDPEDYVSYRLEAPSRDGKMIPISLVRHRDTPLDGTAPLLAYGYGSYGLSMDPWFSNKRLSLLNRGVIYAMLHVRGGQELGRTWYESGRLQSKMNSFYDFIDATEFLIEEKFASPERVAAEGGSAGGLLVGAVVNLRPDLYRLVLADVPFVDVVTTMLDESIPLTTNEYDEWGNPSADRAAYEYMLSYSPYDNVGAHEYPAMLVTTGLHDSQVQYWEPAKWVARLRDRRSGDAPILFHTNMSAGHGGAAGRFEYHRITALQYAFLFHVLDVDP